MHWPRMGSFSRVRRTLSSAGELGQAKNVASIIALPTEAVELVEPHEDGQMSLAQLELGP